MKLGNVFVVRHYILLFCSFLCYTMCGSEKMKELLSPAGNMECLKAAINNGADAVYFAGKLFGARKYATNFTNDELKEAVNYAHLYGVKVYITVNIIVYEEEVNERIALCSNGRFHADRLRRIRKQRNTGSSPGRGRC